MQQMQKIDDDGVESSRVSRVISIHQKHFLQSIHSIGLHCFPSNAQRTGDVSVPVKAMPAASSSRKKSRGRGGKAQAQAAAAATVASGVVNTYPTSPEFSYSQAASGGGHVPTADEILAISMGTAVAVDDDAPSGAAEEALEDVHTRFILNLPDEEFESADRIFFQLEQAYWYYEDLLADAGDDPDQPDMPKIPHYKSLHAFAKVMFQFSPLLEPMLPEFDTMYGAFSKYKRKIGTYGTILLNQDCTRILLCQAYFGNSWTFPAGKVNQNEAGVEAGARETYEETGFDPNCQVGETKRLLEAAAERGEDLPWSGLRSEDALTYIEDGSKKRRTCYVCRGVPEDFPFAPVARKEVKDIQWFDIYDIPKKSYAVTPFIKQLRRWIRKNAKDTLAADSGNNNKRSKSQKKGGRDGSTKKGRASSRASSRGASRGKVREDEDLATSGLAAPGDEKGWTAEDMFKANEKLTGRKSEYDGNPHVFAEKGFDGIDPHAFRVVGGGFMNSGEGIQGLAPAPEKSRLQPLFREGDDGDGEELTPFFSEDGATPWGEVVTEEVGSSAAQSSNKQMKGKKSKKKKKKGEGTADEKEEPVNAGKTLLSMLQGKGGATPTEAKEEGKESSASDAGGTSGGAKTALDIFMTDREITSRSQAEKLGVKAQDAKQGSKKSAKRDDDEHIIYMRQWVENLPQAPATDVFGDFRFDREAILKAMLGVSVTK